MIRKLNDIISKIKYKHLRKIILNNLIEFDKSTKNNKEVGIFFIKNLKYKCLIESINSGIKENCKLYLFFSNNIYSTKQLKLIADILSVFGILLIIITKSNFIKIYDNKIDFISLETNFKNKMFNLDNIHFCLAYKEDIIDPSFLYLNKIKNTEFFILNDHDNIKSIENASNALISFFLYSNKIFVPLIIEKEKQLIYRKNNIVKINLNYSNKIKKYFNKTNNFLLSQIKTEFNNI